MTMVTFTQDEIDKLRKKLASAVRRSKDGETEIENVSVSDQLKLLALMESSQPGAASSQGGAIFTEYHDGK